VKHRAIWLAVPLLISTAPAFAHPGHGVATGFIAGVVHPLTGLDHLLAMVMVGLWAGTAFPRHWWLCPLAFMAFMAGGFAYGAAGGELPIAEALILASLAGLGIALAFQIRPPLALGAALVALFAIGHGFAHGIELRGHDASAFVSGFLLTTGLLHAIGLALSLGLRHRTDRMVGTTAVVTALAMMWSA